MLFGWSQRREFQSPPGREQHPAGTLAGAPRGQARRLRSGREAWITRSLAVRVFSRQGGNGEEVDAVDLPLRTDQKYWNEATACKLVLGPE